MPDEAPAQDVRVDITLPTGEQATVPRADLDQALAAGARPTTAMEGLQRDIGGLAGMGLASGLGLARVATGSLSDQVLAEGANVAFGEDARRDALDAMRLVGQVNPLASMGGEGAGLFVGAGKGITALGELAEKGVAARVGGGLTGKVAAYGARGLVEGAALGMQHQISEDILGDHQTTAEKLFASAAKDGLLGAAAGGVLGGVSHYGGELLTGLRRAPGATSHGALDAIAGVEGAGAALRSEAKVAQGLVGDLEKAGATSQQAARVVDEINGLSRTRSSNGLLSSTVDEIAERYATSRAGDNAELAGVIKRGYAERARTIAQHDEVVANHALKLKSTGDAVLRDLEDTLNEAQFRQKTENIAKLVDGGQIEAQRDAVAAATQDAREMVKFWEGTATKGGAAGALKKTTALLDDAQKVLATLERDPVTGAIKGLPKPKSEKLFMTLDALKQELAPFAQPGRGAYGISEASQDFRGLYGRIRGVLEDEAVWGKAGAAQREWNETFSNAQARRVEFGSRVGNRIDQQGWEKIGAIDAGKAEGILRRLDNPAASLEDVKTFESFSGGLRQRAAALEKYGALTPEQAQKVSKGLTSLDTFDKTWAEARKESEVVARLKKQQLEEQGSAIGGVLGLASDFATKPLQTMERLGAVRAATKKLENAIDSGLTKFFSGKGADIAEAARSVARPKADVAAEITRLKEVASSPLAMQERVQRFVGELSQYAPKTASNVAMTAQRAITFLAQEAPTPTVPVGILAMHHAKPRYSDAQISTWERKRTAAMDPESVVRDMQAGKLNRDAIRAVEFVSPKLFSEMQEMAQKKILELGSKGLLDNMPYQQKAMIATLLKVPADQTWTPDFVMMMQAAKAQPAAPAPMQGPSPGAATVAKRPISLDPSVFMTGAQSVESGGEVK